MNYDKLNFIAFHNYLFDNEFEMREKRLLFRKKHNTLQCVKIAGNGNIITWVEPLNASIEEIAISLNELEEIVKGANNV